MKPKPPAELVSAVLYHQSSRNDSQPPQTMTSTKGKPPRRRCEARRFGGWHWHQCHNAASIERLGHHFCGVCDPVKKEAKRVEREREWQAKWDRRQAQEGRRDSIAAAKAKVVETARDVFRQRATFDDLERAVAALDKAEATT